MEKLLMSEYQNVITDTELNTRMEAAINRCFFIVGCGHSGTTLLQVMLSRHQKIFVVHETGFFIRLEPLLCAKFGKTPSSEDYHRVVHTICNGGYVGYIDYNFLDRALFKRFAFIGPKNWQTLFISLLLSSFSDSDAEIIGEKTPGHVSRIEDLSRWFPHARFIQLVRDPRAVLLSYKKARFSSAANTPLKTTQYWRFAIERYDDLDDDIKDRCLLVHYEELVHSPEATLRDISNFLSVEYDPAMLHPEQRDSFEFSSEKIGHMANTLKPLFTTSVDRWMSDLLEMRYWKLKLI